MRNYNYKWLCLAGLIVVIDQLSKYLIVKNIELYNTQPLLPFLNLTLQHNYGAAFSFLNAAGGWQRWLFVIIAIMVSGFIIWLMRKTASKQYMFLLALNLILGGALGNLIDRIRVGYVTDFIDFHINTWHFAVFNIADSAITIGVILALIAVMFIREQK